MLSFCISNNKLFMHQLLKENLFDSYLVRDVTLHTFIKTHINGQRNTSFYSSDELEVGVSEFVSWEELKSYVFQIMKGSKAPSYFKIILEAPTEISYAFSSDTISAYFLTITFKDNTITCQTGVAYDMFSMDKSCEKQWDETIQSFLLSNQLV